MRPDRDWIRAHMLALDKVLFATGTEARAAYFWASTSWYWSAELEYRDMQKKNRPFYRAVFPCFLRNRYSAMCRAMPTHCFSWWAVQGSNLRPLPCERGPRARLL